MPKDLKDFPRPVSDNGRGLAGSASPGWSGGKEGIDYWVSELVAMGIKWFKVLDAGGASIPLCSKLLAAGIFPIVRIIRKDPPPNDSPEPNPGHINATEEETIRRLIAAGVRYFETNNEPDLASEWKNEAMPGDGLETAKLVALNWLFDARFILAAGGYPGLPAVSVGANMDLIAALVALGRQDILMEGCWIAVHNYCQNRPLDYPDDPIGRSGQPLTPAQYDQGAYTQWAWWRQSIGRADTIEEINVMRAASKNPTQTIQQDHSSFREFEYYNSLSMKYLGRSIPVISTEGGYIVSRREDARYPRVTPEAHRDLTVAIFDFMQRQAPDYYFAAVSSQLIESEDMEDAGWYSQYWKSTFQKGSDGLRGIPTIPVPGAALGDRLPVIDAVKAMPNLVRRMPGDQPAPPTEPTVAAPVKLTPLKYVVVAGDTLTKIAKQFGTSWQDIAALNQFAGPDLIRAGQTLLIPRPGDMPQTMAPLPPEKISTQTSARPGLSVLFPEPEAVHPAPERSGSEESLATSPEAPSGAVRFGPPPPPAKATTLSPVAPPPPPAVFPVSTTAGFISSAPPPPLTEPPPPPLSEPAPPPPLVEPAQPARPVLAPPPKLPNLAAPAIELEWDWRLDALGVALEPANTAPGQEYWKLVRAVYQAPDEAGGNHHIYYMLLDENQQPMANQKVWQGWPEDKTDATTNDQGESNIPLWASFAPDRNEQGPYFAWIDGLPSDRVIGMGLPLKRHVSFFLTWQRTVA